MRSEFLVKILPLFPVHVELSSIDFRSDVVDSVYMQVTASLGQVTFAQAEKFKNKIQRQFFKLNSQFLN